MGESLSDCLHFPSIFYSFFIQAYPDSVLDFKLCEGPDVVLYVVIASIGLKTEAELMFIGDGSALLLLLVRFFSHWDCLMQDAQVAQVLALGCYRCVTPFAKQWVSP